MLATHKKRLKVNQSAFRTRKGLLSQDTSANEAGVHTTWHLHGHAWHSHSVEHLTVTIGHYIHIPRVHSHP